MPWGLGFIVSEQSPKEPAPDRRVSGVKEATPASSESLCGYIISRRPMMYLQINHRPGYLYLATTTDRRRARTDFLPSSFFILTINWRDINCIFENGRIWRLDSFQLACLLFFFRVQAWGFPLIPIGFGTSSASSLVSRNKNLFDSKSRQGEDGAHGKRRREAQ